MKALCGAGSVPIREAARRVDRDVKAVHVHGDVTALLTLMRGCEPTSTLKFHHSATLVWRLKSPMLVAPSPTRNIIHLALPMLVAQVAVMLNGTVDTVMAGQISPLDLATVGIGASIHAAIFISTMGVLLALTPIIAHHYGAGRDKDIGEEVRQGAWLSLGLAAITMVVLTHPGPLLALSQLTPEMDVRVRDYLAALAWATPAGFAFRLLYGFSAGSPPAPASAWRAWV